MDIEPIYMDQIGYQNHLAQIDALKKEIGALSEERKKEKMVIDRDSWNNPGTADIDRQERVLLARLQELLDKLPRISIIENHFDKESIDINDIVTVEYCYGNEETEEETVRLVGGLTDNIDGVFNVTINSPLGSLIYRKKVGETVAYQVEGCNISATIKQIIKGETLGTR